MECSVCKKPTDIRCSRCKVKYYCSKSCQKKDYNNHALDCPSRTADILVKNALDDKIPTNLVVQYEYGFANCMGNPDEQSKLLGLYIGLVKGIEISASQIHSWWENGELSLNIKKAYDNRGYPSNYYKWFLKNEHFLQDLHKYEGEKSDKSIADKYFAMVKPYLSKNDQTVSVVSLPESKRKVTTFYTIILLGCIPRIEQEYWIDFGFCSCKFGKDLFGETDEMRLSRLYRELIVQKGCKIDEFNDAYVSGSVMDLLKKKCDKSSWLSENGIEIHGKQSRNSVYYLKQYALSEFVDLNRSVKVDYGFMNCHTEAENRQLKLMYKKLIKARKFNPQDLHNACLKGKIFDYVSSILPNNEVMKADLLKNPYPLEDLE